MNTHFNTIIIGKGLVGSAAAKYLSATNKDIAIIGPDEPNENDESIVYASHYDQARVQRIIGKDAVWTKLNLDSANEYKSIENQTGIQFHHPVGCLYVYPYGSDDYLKNAPILSKDFNLSFKNYDNSAAINNDFKAFRFPYNSQGLLETSPAGYINPRLLLQAQLQIYKTNNGTVIKDTVISISHSKKLFTINTNKGDIYTAEKVLVATGSFINYLNILPQKLQLQTKNEVIILVKVSEEYAKSVSLLPSLLYEIDDAETQGIYMIQPVLYPDGNYYYKIGSNTNDDFYFDSLEQVQHWFKNGNADSYKPILTKAIKKIVPDLQIDEVIIKKCIISWTAHKRPYIGETTQKDLYVAGGCNGYSAMCSDAIGSVASHLILNGKMPTGYKDDAFELVYG
ncbi:MAG: NAD(P)/FAD-dependent oxidoreductase [Chitinophagaceae bacterium]